MAWDEGFDESHLHEDCLPRDQAFTHVMENDFDDVREAVAEADAQDWLAGSVDTLELINVVSTYDRERLRTSLRDVLNIDKGTDREAEPEEFFPVAAEVATLMERTRSPYADACNITESVGWAKELVEIVRLFRDILFARSEEHQAVGGLPKLGVRSAESPKLSQLDQLATALRQHDTVRASRDLHDRLNDILQHGIVYRLRQEGRGPARIVREVDAQKTPLRVHLAFWISTYLGLHERYVDLAVCAECGKIFSRGRRDNVYCSKTCQNRVAYKRKKIFVAGVLREVDVQDSRSLPNRLSGLELTGPDTPIVLCLNHPRFGLGLVESVQHPRRRLRLKYEDSVVVKDIPADKTADEFFEELKTAGELAITVVRPEALTVDALGDALTETSMPIEWTEIVQPGNQQLTVRFLSGVRRFHQREVMDLKFYVVEDPRLLAELL
jgi:hypothetical protein